LNRKGSSIGGGCLFLFAIPFAAAGIFCLFAAWAVCWKAQEVRLWELLDATIETVPEKKQGHWDELTYRYRWEGRWITATNGVDGDFMNPKAEIDFWKRVSEAKEYEETIPVWVNPKRPDKSYVLPPRASFAPLMVGIFAISHGGIGLGLMTASFLTIRAERHRAKAERQWPEQPWKWRKDWVRGVAKVSRPPWHWLIGYFTLVVLSLGSWMGFLLFTEPNATLGNRVLALIMISAGLLFAWFCARQFKQYRRNQEFTLKLPLDGLVAGETTQLLLEDSAASAYRLHEATRTWTLKCVGETSDGENSSTASLWQGEVDVKAESGRSRELTVTIPAGAPLTSCWSHSGKGIRWELVGKGSNRSKLGPFLLPVFRSNEASQEAVETFQPANDDSDQPLQPDAWNAAFQAEQIDFDPGASPAHFVFGPRRHSMPATTSMIIGVAFTAFGFGFQFIPNFIPRIFGGIFGLVGLFMLKSAFWQNFGTFTLDVDDQGLRLSKTLFGKTRETTWAPDQIDDIVAANAAAYNDVQFYVIHLVPKVGKKVTLTPLIATWSTADAFSQTLLQSLGRPRPEVRQSGNNEA
tara:strand:- start:2863 stop:4599 length:1737 start_codon:yes stop_codon:yes gene_type:complete